mmetsp:Transcript_105971/g.300062  ORF Transcript_105971/g.300062 Transcript_105971/m.300062 type:complete len:212 (-) Transcript_105971:732-1367(-)
MHPSRPQGHPADTAAEAPRFRQAHRGDRDPHVRQLVPRVRSGRRHGRALEGMEAYAVSESHADADHLRVHGGGRRHQRRPPLGARTDQGDVERQRHQPPRERSRLLLRRQELLAAEGVRPGVGGVRGNEVAEGRLLERQFQRPLRRLRAQRRDGAGPGDPRGDEAAGHRCESHHVEHLAQGLLPGKSARQGVRHPGPHAGQLRARARRGRV